MGWERRDGGGVYYYRKRRDGGRVVSVYVGGGRLGELAARADELRREQREAWRQEKAAAQAIDQEVNAACDLIRALRYGVMLTAGYHTHKGQWRKERDDG